MHKNYKGESCQTDSPSESRYQLEIIKIRILRELKYIAVTTTRDQKSVIDDITGFLSLTFCSCGEITIF